MQLSLACRHLLYLDFIIPHNSLLKGAIFPLMHVRKTRYQETSKNPRSDIKCRACTSEFVGNERLTPVPQKYKINDARQCAKAIHIRNVRQRNERLLYISRMYCCNFSQEM